jgi:hypothetical protein
MRRHYLTVVYAGDEPRHYTSHYKNEMAPIEALPIQQTPAEVTDEQVPPPTSNAEKKGKESTTTETKSGDVAPAEGEGGKPEGGESGKEK